MPGLADDAAPGAAPPPVRDIDPAAFWADPYPDLARLRREAPIARVPQLGSILITTRDLIAACDRPAPHRRLGVSRPPRPARRVGRLNARSLTRTRHAPA